jgi:hypothetical protein
MPETLLFLQDPHQFLQSYFWVCNQGHTLSLRCKDLLNRILSIQPDANYVESAALLSNQLMESVLDCYVHTKVCFRCEPIDRVPCQQGYELILARDIALDEARRMAIDDRPTAVAAPSLSEEQLKAAGERELTRQQFLLHMTTCHQCTTEQPRGRYGLAAWNIETARLQRA